MAAAARKSRRGRGAGGVNRWCALVRVACGTVEGNVRCGIMTSQHSCQAPGWSKRYVRVTSSESMGASSKTESKSATCTTTPVTLANKILSFLALKRAFVSLPPVCAVRWPKSGEICQAVARGMHACGLSPAHARLEFHKRRSDMAIFGNPRALALLQRNDADATFR